MTTEALYFNIAKRLNVNNFDNFMDYYGLTYSEMLGIIDYGLNSNISLVQLCSLKKLLEMKKNLFSISDKKVGIITDTHIGSKHMNWDDIKMCYDFFAQNDIYTVLHLGDLFDAFPKNKKGRNDAIFKCYQQLVEWQSKYPTGFNTFLLHGNHDELFSLAGIDLWEQIETRRDDWFSIGKGACYLKFGNFDISLVHPLQNKTIVSYELNSDVVLRGHSHLFAEKQNTFFITSCCYLNTRYDSLGYASPGCAILSATDKLLQLDGYIFDNKDLKKLLTYTKTKS